MKDSMRGIWAAVLRNPLRTVIGVWLLYVVVFPIGHGSFANDMFAGAAVGPGLLTSHLFRLKGAKWVAALFFPVQALLYVAADHNFGWDMVVGVEGLFGLSIIPIVILYAGYTAGLRHKLVEIQDQRDRFIAAVSHDVKTPLTGVIGLSLALEEDPMLGDEQRELAGLIASEAQAATGVIEDLSVTALSTSGVFQTHPELFVFADEVIAAAHRIEGVFLDIEPDIEVWADRRRVTQILNNLFTNAARHGLPPIEAIIYRRNSQAVLEVRDHGDGIPTDHLDQLFEPFGMVGVSGHVESTGLGLSSSRVLATLMNGTLDYHHDGGRTTFTFALPLRSADVTPGSVIAANTK